MLGQLQLLQQLYSEIVIPSAVNDELMLAGSGVVAVDVDSLRWIRVVAVRDRGRVNSIVGLDRGEAEVLALAQEISADLVLIDERLGRRYAQRLGLSMSGTLGVLLKAKQLGLVDTVGPLLEALRQGRIHLSQTLIEETLRLAGEI